MSQSTLMASDNASGHGPNLHAASPHISNLPLVPVLEAGFCKLANQLLFLIGQPTPPHASTTRRMDGFSEESPLTKVIQVWDFAETVLETYPGLPFALCAACAYLALARRWRNVWLVLGFTAWLKRSAISSCVGQVCSLGTILQLIAGVSLAWLIAGSLATWKARVEGVDAPGPAQPYLIPCRTTHTRLVPKKHSFEYPMLLAGVPVGWRGVTNDMLSVDPGKRSSLTDASRGWYNVDSSDYLERTTADIGLRGKLDKFLLSQGIEPSTYAHAYLVTAPKLLGYAFNPVSFWYLYSSEKVFSAMVLEVNNTFGEKHSYFVPRDFDAESKPLASVDGQKSATPRAKVKNTWAKDFHVSPFNSRKGVYSLRAADPLGEGMEGFRGIDVTITLASSKSQSKIVARLYSEGEAFAARSMDAASKFRFLFSRFWVGFITLPGIILEAMKLSLKHKLHVWYHPEPRKDSMSRVADNTELALEVAFREYLRSLVESSPSALAVTYVPAGVNSRDEETFKSGSADSKPNQCKSLKFKVLTPLFYARFAGYAHDVEAIFCEMAESCTLWVDEPDTLPHVFIKRPSPPLHTQPMTDFVAFKAIQNLRSRPEIIKRPMTSADPQLKASSAMDIRNFRMSSMDAFILGQDDVGLKKSYRNAVLELFLARVFSLGSVALLRMGISAVNIGCALAVAWNLAGSTEPVN